MGSATFKALAVTAVLVLTVTSGAIASGRSDSAAMPADAAPHTAQVAAGDQASSSHANFSTLAALGLGIIGLLWVRRHTAEL